MAGKSPDYNVMVSRKGSDGKNHYSTVGAAWNVAKDGISIELQALPTDGRLVMFPRRDDQGS